MKANQSTSDSDLDQITKMIADRDRVVYQRGWDDAVAAMTAAVGKSTPQASSPKKTIAVEKRAPAKRKAPKAFLVHKGPSKARAIVLETIRQNPGRSGTEIAAMVGAAVNKHTVRTQLRKLKRSGEVEQTTALRWYAKGDQRQPA
jgi:hypothetical protein